MKKRYLAFVMAMMVMVSSVLTGAASQPVYAAGVQTAAEANGMETIEPAEEAEMTVDSEMRAAENGTGTAEASAANAERVYKTGLIPMEVYEIPQVEGDQIYDAVQYTDIDGALYGSSVYASEWDKYSTNYFYNQLTSEEKTFWDTLDAVCLSYLLGTADAESLVYQNATHYTTEYVSGGTLTWAEATTLARIFRYSNPQYYFLSTSIWGNQPRNIIGFGIYPAFADGNARKTETAKVKSQADAWISAASQYGTEAEKVKYLHDAVVNKVDYNDAIYESSFDENVEFSQSAYSVFCTDLTVCAGYSQALQMLCNGAGIDAVSVTSDSHQWNKIRINHSWYNVDATWADLSNENLINYSYFERSDAVYDGDAYQRNALAHAEESIWMGYLPLCTLDSGSSGYIVGTLPVITSTTAAPMVSISNDKAAITCATPGAVIYYTTDGTNPSSAYTRGFKYTGAFKVKSGATVRALAVCNGCWDSAVTEKKNVPEVPKDPEIPEDSEVKKIIYKVTFDGNGSTSGHMSSQSFEYGVSKKLSVNLFKRTGYVFKGWNTKANGKGQSYKDQADGSMLTQTNGATVKLYAQWERTKQKIAYKVTFDGNGSTSGSMSSQSFEYGVSKKLSPNKFKRAGYTFKGWNTKANGKGQSYKNQADGSMLTQTNGATVKLYAQWECTRYAITYKLNGGKNNKANPSAYTKTTKTITLKKPTKKGYTFKGWYTDAKCTKKITQIKKGSTGKKTLYAKWAVNTYTVKFNGNKSTSGRMSNQTGCKYGKSYKLKKNTFQRKGYTFVGWNTKADGSGKSYKNRASIKNLTSKNGKTIILYAQWKKIK